MIDWINIDGDAGSIALGVLYAHDLISMYMTSSPCSYFSRVYSDFQEDLLPSAIFVALSRAGHLLRAISTGKQLLEPLRHFRTDTEEGPFPCFVSHFVTGFI